MSRLLSKALLRAPAWTPVGAAHGASSLDELLRSQRRPEPEEVHFPSPPAPEPPRVRLLSRPALFTAEFVEQQGAETVARLLDACFYDLVALEKELLRASRPIVLRESERYAPRAKG